MRCIAVDGLYSVWVEEIAKVDTPCRDVDEITVALQACICHLGATALIGVFDHYGFNLRAGAPLPMCMQDAKTILFCRGSLLLDPMLLALCPSAIGVADMGNRFVISFLDAPAVFPAETVGQWVEDLHMAIALQVGKGDPGKLKVPTGGRRACRRRAVHS
jgi:hypothetical protein